MELRRAPLAEELLRLVAAYQAAERKTMRELARKQAGGLVDYGEDAAIGRVQASLRELGAEAADLALAGVERQFYLTLAGEAAYRNLERLPIAKLREKHAAGYASAGGDALARTQSDVAARLAQNLAGELAGAAGHAGRRLGELRAESIAIGRLRPGTLRSAALESVAIGEAAGYGAGKTAALFRQALAKEGVTGFTDVRGRKWPLGAYAAMAVRTAGMQAANLATLFRDPEQDLFKISSHYSTCPVCAPLEGRVYSRSGASASYPPLARAFGKVDRDGPDDLGNSYLNIHPNCLHVLIPWIEEGRPDKEIEEARRFSSFERNPPTVDPRSEARREAYRAKEDGHRRFMDTIKQYERYRAALGDGVPKTFRTFVKHKLEGTEKYKAWVAAYRSRARRG
ncbi:MAG: phage minor capsid protein [Clostridiales bacterium]|nr:phage minor capsid protein [Clostridiales bacterium]